MPIHIGSTKFNNEFRTTQDLNFLLSCIGEKIFITTEFYYEDIRVPNANSECLFAPDASITGTLTNPQELVFFQNAFADYQVGDRLRVVGSTGGNNSAPGSYFTVTEKLSNSLIRCGGATFVAESLAFTAYIANVTPFNGVKWAYNVIQGAANYNSLVDGELQQLKYGSADATNVAPANMFFNGITSYQIGGATVQGVSFTNERQTFKIIHTTLVTPWFLASQWATLLLGVKPADYAAGNCPNYVYKLEMLRALSNPTSLQALSVNNPANVGWFGENFNGNPTNYSVSAFTIQKVSDSSFIQKLIFDEDLNLVITLSNATSTPFSNNNTKYCVHFIYLPENETLYQNNGRTLAQNFVFDRKFTTIGAAVSNGDNFGTGYQVIKNTEGIFDSTSQVRIKATISLGADAKSIIQQGDFSRYMIWVTTENHALTALNSDKVPLLVQVDEFFVTTTVSDLIKCTNNFIQHPFIDKSDGIKDNLEVFPVDDVAARCEFYIDLASYPNDGIRIKKIRPKILLRKAGSPDIILDDFSIDVSAYPLIGLAQNIAFTQDRVFKIPAGEVRKVITIARDYAADVDNGFTNWYINWPFMVRWAEYIQLLNLPTVIPADLIDIAKPFNGLNEFWHRFTTLTGWSLKFEIDFTFQQKGDEALQSFTSSIKSFDFEGGPAYDGNWIKFYDNDDNTELIIGGVKKLQGWKPTRIEAVFNKVFGTFPDLANAVIVIWIEPFEAGGIGIIRRISSKYVLDSQSWFLSTDGSGLVVMTNPVAGRYKGVALVNPAVLPANNKYQFYARLYDATDYDCMTIVYECAAFAAGVMRLRMILLSGTVTIDWGNGDTTTVNPSASIQTIESPYAVNATYTITICGSLENISHFDLDTHVDGVSPINNFIRSANLTRLESDMSDFGTLSIYSSKIGNADVVFPQTNRHFNLVRFVGYNSPFLVGTTPFNTVMTALDFTGMTGRFAAFTVDQMRALASVTFDPATEITTTFTAVNTALNQVFDFGTKVFAQTITYRNNLIAAAITQANLDANIDNIYQNRVAYQVRTGGPKTFTANANNPAPSGTLVAPAGYIQADAVTAGNDGAPANAKEQIYVLLNQKIDFTTTSKYNWSAFNVN